MKKVLLWLSGIIALFLLIILGAAAYMLNNAEWHKKLLLEALEDAGFKATVEHVAVGLAKGRVEQLTLSKDELSLEMPDLEVKYSLWALIFSNHINIESLRSQDIRVRLTEAKSEGDSSSTGSGKDNPESSAPFDGIFKTWHENGAKLTVKTLELNGSIDLASGETANISINGGGIQAGEVGSIDYQIGLKGLDDLSNLPSSIKGTIELELDSLGAPTRLQLQSNGSLHRQQAKLDVIVAMLDGANAEQISAKLSVPGLPDPLFKLDGKYDYEAKHLSGELRSRIKHSELQFIPGIKSMPSFALKYDSRFKWTPSANMLEMQAESDVRLADLLPGRQVGDTSLKAKADLVLDPKQLSLNQFKLEVASQDEKPFIGASLSQPVQIPLSSDVKFPSSNKALGQLELALPLPLFSSFLMQDGAITNGLLVGKSDLVSKGEGRFELRASKEWELSSFSTERSGQQELSAINAKFIPSIEYQYPMMRVMLNDMVVVSVGLPALKGALLADLSFKDSQMDSITLKGNQDLSVKALRRQPMIANKLSALPPSQLDSLSAKVEYDLVLRPGLGTEVNRLDVLIDGEGQGSSLRLSAMQRFELPEDLSAFDFKQYTGELLKLKANAFPLPLFGMFSPGMSLGGIVNGTVIMSSDSGKIVYRTVTPLEGQSISYAMDKQGYLDDVDVKLEGGIRLDKNTSEWAFSQLAISDRSGPLVSGALNWVQNASGGTDNLKAIVNGDMARILNQPALKAYDNVSSGQFRLNAQAKATAPAELDLEMQLEIQRLSLEDPQYRFDTINLNYKGHLKNDPFYLKFDTPVAIQSQSGSTNAVLSFVYDSTKPEKLIDLLIKGDTLVVDDLQTLPAAFENPTAKGRSTVVESSLNTANANPDRVPFWSGTTGDVKVDLKELRYGPNKIHNALGDLTMTPNKLHLKSMNGLWGGAPMSLNGIFTFDENKVKQPYDFSAKFGVTQLDIGRAFEISEWIQGLFDINANVYSNGANLDQVMQLIKGKLEVSSREGILHVAKDARSAGLGILGGASQLLKLPSGLINGLGDVFGDKMKNKMGLKDISKTLSYIPDLFQLLEKIAFQRFDLKMTRDESLNIVLDYAKVRGEGMSLAGAGRVSYVEGVPIMEQPLNMQVQLAVNDTMAGDLSRLVNVSADKDGDGFYRAHSFPVTGTLSKPEFHILKQLLKGAEGVIQKLIPGRSKSNQRPQQKPRNQTPVDAINNILNIL